VKTDIGNSKLGKLVKAAIGKGRSGENERIQRELVERQEMLDRQFPGRAAARAKAEAELEAVTLPDEKLSPDANKISRSPISPESDHITRKKGLSRE
jgi:hypothetical protein